MTTETDIIFQDIRGTTFRVTPKGELFVFLPEYGSWYPIDSQAEAL